MPVNFPHDKFSQLSVVSLAMDATVTRLGCQLTLTFKKSCKFCREKPCAMERHAVHTKKEREHRAVREEITPKPKLPENHAKLYSRALHTDP